MSPLFRNSHARGCAGFWFCACSGLPIVPEGGGGAAAPQRAPVISVAAARARSTCIRTATSRPRST